MRPHIIQALADLDEPVSDILYANLLEINEKSMAIARVLSQKNDTRVIPFLNNVLRSDHRDFQMEAMQLLQTMPDTSSITPLIHLTKHRRDRKRCIRAIETLGYIQNQKSMEHLTALLEDRDKEIRKSAVLALGHQKSPAVVSALITMFDDDERLVANQTMTALTQLGDIAVDSLRKALHSDKASTVWRAMATLGELKADSAIDDIIPLLNHPNIFTRT